MSGNLWVLGTVPGTVPGTKLRERILKMLDTIGCFIQYSMVSTPVSSYTDACISGCTPYTILPTGQNRESPDINTGEGVNNGPHVGNYSQGVALPFTLHPPPPPQDPRFYLAPTLPTRFPPGHWALNLCTSESRAIVL
jgi:hypothetical protein